MRLPLAALVLALGLAAGACAGSKTAAPGAAGVGPAPTPAVPVPTPESPVPTPAPTVLQAAPPGAASAASSGAAAQEVPSPAPPPAAAVPEQPPPVSAADRPYLDILKLKQAGFSDEFLLNKVQTDNVPYRLTTAEILELRNAGVSETLLAAMLRSGQPQSALAGTPVARKAEFSGLLRVSKGFLGVFGTSSKSVGRLVVDGEKILWYETNDASENFSIYAKNVKEIFNTCVLRPGENLCLEFGLVTFTGEELRFRDPGWKNGDNRLVTEATAYFRQAFPQLFFSQRTVSEM